MTFTFQMRIEGDLVKWNDDRGFGFIAPTQGGPEIFVHISAFPKDGHRPTIGERLTFQIENNREGKQRAKNLVCPTRPAVRATRRTVSHRRNEEPGFLGRSIPLAIVVALAFYGYSQYSGRIAPQAVVAAPSSDRSASSSFRCDGRTYCSQMSSCAEATFFPRNCPDVQMDGNHDGVPCERQWCTSRFALHNIADSREREQALREIIRVMKPGVRVAIVDVWRISQYRRVFRASGMEQVRLSWPSFWFLAPSFILTAAKPAR